MGTTPGTTKKSRSDVRREYGHPWPWMNETLFREHVIEADTTRRQIARAWATNTDTIRKWERRHGFRRDREASP